MIEEFDLRYRKGLPFVLKQINCDIKPGEKVLQLGNVYIQLPWCFPVFRLVNTNDFYMKFISCVLSSLFQF